jgi:hypothetical protein
LKKGKGDEWQVLEGKKPVFIQESTSMSIV